MTSLSVSTRKHVLSIVAVLAAGLIAYSNTFHVPFQLDEEFYLLKNPFVRDCRYPLDSLKPKQEAGTQLREEIIERELYRTVNMRYIGYLTFAMNHYFGGYRVEGYHIVNLLVHLLNGVLLYGLLVTMFKTPLLRLSSFADRAVSIAFFSALLFVAHPVQTEAVTYIMQRLASLVTFFYVLSIFAYVLSRLTTSRLLQFALLSCSIISAVCAMKTKENAFTLPFMIAAFEFILFPGDGNRRLARLTPLFATILIIPIMLWTINGGGTGAVLSGQGGVTPQTYFFTQLRVIAGYLGLLFLPVNQTISHSVQLSRSFFEVEVLLSFLLIICIAACGWHLLRSRAADAWPRVVALGILWFFVSLSIESSILPLPILMCEYRIYLPSVGFFMSVVTAVHAVAGNSMDRRIRHLATGALAAAAIALICATYARNMKWGTSISLWEDAAGKNPAVSGAVHMKLGELYMQQGRFDQAIERFLTAIRGGMEHPRLHYELATAYNQQGRSDEAIQEYRRVIRSYPDFADAHYNLANLLAERGRYDEAVAEYLATLRLNPGSAQAHNNLGGVYVRLGRFREALEEVRAALKLDPGFEDARYNLTVVTELVEQERKRQR